MSTCEKHGDHCVAHNDEARLAWVTRLAALRGRIEEARTLQLAGCDGFEFMRQVGHLFADLDLAAMARLGPEGLAELHALQAELQQSWHTSMGRPARPGERGGRWLEP